MKIRVFLSIGLVGRREESIDVEDWGYTDEEWLAASEDERQELVSDWAFNFIEYGYAPLDD